MRVQVIGKPIPEFENLNAEDLERILGTPEEIVAGMERHGRGHDYLRSAEIAHVYPGEYVAALESHVIAHSKSYEEFLEELHSSGVPLVAVAIRQVPAA